MSIIRTSNLKELSNFPKRTAQLAIAERHVPKGSDTFFQKLMKQPLKVISQVRKTSAVRDIKYLLSDEISEELQNDPFYNVWITDMAQVCETFCNTLGNDSVGFCLSTERGCRRYHIDNVDMRLLVTYAGQGTEWIPDEAADRRAQINGAPNEEIIKDPSARRFMNEWDVSIFRGGPKGLLHRTPDQALNGNSLLLRLDHASFWGNILKEQRQSDIKSAVNA